MLKSIWLEHFFSLIFFISLKLSYLPLIHKSNLSNNLLYRFLFFCGLCLSLVLEANAQVLLKTMAVENIQSFTTDEMGNLFIAKTDGTVSKWSRDGDSLANYRIIKNGFIQCLDASNPLELLVLQPQYNRLTVLDRMMSLKAELDLGKLNLYQLSACCQSADGFYWLYDNINQCLVKIDKQLNKVLKSNDLRIEQGISLNPTYLEERGDRVVLTDPEQGIFIFDRYGSLLQVLPIYNIKQFQLLENWLVYYDKGQLEVYDFDAKSSNSFTLPSVAENILNARLSRERIFVLTPKHLYIFAY